PLESSLAADNDALSFAPNLNEWVAFKIKENEWTITCGCLDGEAKTVLVSGKCSQGKSRCSLVWSADGSTVISLVQELADNQTATRSQWDAWTHKDTDFVQRCAGVVESLDAKVTFAVDSVGQNVI